MQKVKDTVEIIQMKETCQDLRQRIILVEGERKANYETSHSQIKQNAEIIRQIKQENNNCRQQITAIHGENKGAGKKVDPLTQKQNQLKQINKHLNEIKDLNRMTTEEITKLNSAVVSARHNAKNPKDPNAADVRQQRTLSNRLDKAMIKYNEAMSIKKTYETIRKRLQDDRISFDNQLQSLERTLKSKEKDYEELLLLSHDAYHAKEMAQAELHRFEQGVMEERNQRDREVAEKKALVQQRVEMNARLEAQQQIVKQHDQIDEMANTAVKTTASVSIEAQKTTITEREDQANMLQDFADAFNKLREVTGISDYAELVQKMDNQQQTFKDLNQMKEQNEQTIKELITNITESKRVLEKLKFQGTGDGKTKPTQTVREKNKELIDFKLELKKISQALDTKKEKLATSAETLNSLKSAIDHLYHKLHHRQYNWPSLSPSGTATISVGYYEDLANSFDEALTHIEKKIEYFGNIAGVDAISTEEAIKNFELNRMKMFATFAQQTIAGDNPGSDEEEDAQDNDLRAQRAIMKSTAVQKSKKKK